MITVPDGHANELNVHQIVVSYLQERLVAADQLQNQPENEDPEFSGGDSDLIAEFVEGNSELEFAEGHSDFSGIDSDDPINEPEFSEGESEVEENDPDSCPRIIMDTKAPQSL